MPSYTQITLDTVAPSSPSVSAPSISASNTVNLTLSAVGADTTSMRIYGDVIADATSNPVQASAPWIAYTTSQAVTTTAGDGSKIIKVQFRDDVYNISTEASATTTVNATAPVVTITGSPASKVSEQTGKNTVTFNITADDDFVAYKVKLVTNNTDGEASGTSLIAETAGTWTSASSIPISITGTTLKTANAGSDFTNKYIKVFVKTNTGIWSV